MAWSLDTKKDKGLSPNSKLPVGRKTYKIVSSTQKPDTGDQSGKTMTVVLGVSTGGSNYTVFLNVEREGQQGEIALQTLRDIAAACGIVKLSPKNLVALVGKSVVIDVVEKQGKGENADKTYSNIRTVEAVGGEQEEDSDGDDADDADTPPAKPAKKPKPAPEPEDDDDDDDEDDDDDDDDDDDEDDSPPPAKKPSGAKKRPWD